MTTYLYWHALSAAIAAWLLIRTVSCGTLAGMLGLIACALLGPLALGPMLGAAFFAINSGLAEIDRNNEDRRMYDPEFYKHKHDRRHK